MSPHGAPPREIHEASRAQIRAAAPGGSAWVSANAGSGKTRVLTDRVARLLLAGNDPARILCLTYTKAAAAEMQNRLFETLGGWAMMEDDALAGALAALSEEDESFDAERLAAARRLFARALETPGGLKIQTIHAFCDALLRRFPLEAGVSPRFEVMDDRSAARMAEAIRDRMAVRAETGEDAAFDAAADRLSEQGLDGLIAEALSKRDSFPDDALATLAAAFGVSEDYSEADAANELIAELDQKSLIDLEAALRKGSSSDQKAAERLAPATRHWQERPLEAVAALNSFTHTDKGEPRKTKSFPTKSVREATPGAAEGVEELIAFMAEGRERLAAARALERARDLHRFARALLSAYDEEKTRAGALDFADLVDRTAALLTVAEMAGWALYKLDGGIDHLLIDEAQDTSPTQWTVIRAIADEFFAGEGARDRSRTLFAVGDEKQSIYSFQGADPREFSRWRDHFDARLAEAETGLHRGALAHSFRSSPAVLRVVDATFAGDAAEGLNAEGAPPRHVAFHSDAPGLVELWPFREQEEGGEEPHWTEPVDAPAPGDPRALLAVEVAEHVDALIKEGAPLPDRRNGGWRRMTPGDVLILVRRRDQLARGIIRELKRRGVDVAGEDRLKLTAELAVKDLLAVLRAAADREDELSLAAALRSPLGGLSEEDLFDLAHGRRTRLIQALRDRAEAFPDAAALMADLRDRADFDRPYELLERILVRHDGRAKLLARLGPEAEDAIDELLALALDYERVETPTLTGFLAWIDADENEIKREQSARSAEVRVMTVHGAKGLEAPFVILPDAGPRKSPRTDAILRLPGADGPVAAWSAAKSESPEALRAAMEEAAARAEEESRRLLYVALTRAEDRLLVCGAGGAKDYEGCWHDLVRAGMEASGAVAEADGTLRLAERWTPVAPEAADAAPREPRALPALAALSGRAAPAAPSPPPRLNASALGGEEGHAPGLGLGRELARRRGDAIHLLLERAPADAAQAEALLASEFPDLPPDLRAEAAEEARAALALPELAPLMSAEALTEAGISALLPEHGLRVAGRVDRLLCAPDATLLIDWKTGAAPDGPEAAPENYLRQMAAYRAALMQLRPGLPVRAGLVWTRAPRLDWLPDAALDAAFARLVAEGARDAAAP